MLVILFKKREVVFFYIGATILRTLYYVCSTLSCASTDVSQTCYVVNLRLVLFGYFRESS